MTIFIQLTIKLLKKININDFNLYIIYNQLPNIIYKINYINVNIQNSIIVF